MFERITPEIMTIAIAVLAVLTLFIFLVVLVQITLLSIVKKRLSVVGKEFLELEEQIASHRKNNQTIKTHATHLDEAAKKIEAVERRLNEFNQKIAANQNQLTGHASKLNEHDAILAEVGPVMAKGTTDFTRAIQRIHTIEGDFHNLKAFQRIFEQTRHLILDALGTMQGTLPDQDTQIREQKALREEALIASEERRSDSEDFPTSRTRYPEPPRVF